MNKIKYIMSHENEAQRKNGSVKRPRKGERDIMNNWSKKG